MTHPANPTVGGTPLPKPSLPNPNALEPSGIKVSAHIQPEPRPEELRHLQQMGVTHCYCWVSEEQCNVSTRTQSTAACDFGVYFERRCAIACDYRSRS